MTWIRDFHGV